MLSKNIEKMLADQVNFEIYSAYIYLAMGAYSDSIDMPGAANWFKIQWEEEIFHANKLYDYLLERDGRQIFAAIPQPQSEWESLQKAFEGALTHEQLVTSRINDIMAQAEQEKDYATRSFLQWFVDEQVEEESNVRELIRQIKMVKDSGHGLYMLDKELAARTFTPPTGA